MGRLKLRTGRPKSVGNARSQRRDPKGDLFVTLVRATARRPCSTDSPEEVIPWQRTTSRESGWLPEMPRRSRRSTTSTPTRCDRPVRPEASSPSRSSAASSPHEGRLRPPLGRASLSRQRNSAVEYSTDPREVAGSIPVVAPVGIAQLAERLADNQEARGSSPLTGTLQPAVHSRD